ncbi:hypothetical protein L195_g039271 [Trifolium pratense]|uniref:Uncharacterized protein n=1 Tax=Trifolium pratense TaxID=57577 RepID=A0A2K3LXG9_TRIPR|nr:hypothetical protein L195_g039271 [Trifolium pratense]
MKKVERRESLKRSRAREKELEIKEESSRIIDIRETRDKVSSLSEPCSENSCSWLLAKREISREAREVSLLLVVARKPLTSGH